MGTAPTCSPPRSAKGNGVTTVARRFSNGVTTVQRSRLWLFGLARPSLLRRTVRVDSRGAIYRVKSPVQRSTRPKFSRAWAAMQHWLRLAVNWLKLAEALEQERCG
jgi:hypothetical protein